MGFLSKDEKVIIGINPDLIKQVKNKVKKIHEEKEVLRKDYKELSKKMGEVEQKYQDIQSKFNKFKKELTKDFMKEAKKVLEKDKDNIHQTVLDNQEKLNELINQLSIISRRQEDTDYVTPFQDYYQSIKLCMYLITNLDARDASLIYKLLRTIHSVSKEMISHGYWEASSDAVITSLVNLMNYWQSKDDRVAGLIRNEIHALKRLR
jgi:chromosome segregation ATPase